MGIVGYDHLGFAHPHYLRKDVCELTPKGSAIGVFHNEFGPVLPYIRETLVKYPGKFPVWRIHLWWGGKQHLIAPLNFIKTTAPAYERLALDFPEVTFYLSHSCEYRNATPSQVRQRLILLRNIAPHCLRVDCPESGKPLVGPVGENHDPFHTLRSPYLTSLDGAAKGAGVWDTDMRAWKRTHKNAAIRYAWIPQYNCRTENETAPPLPPQQRPITLTVDDIKYVIQYAS